MADYDYWMERINADSGDLEDAPDEIKDEEMCIAALRQDGLMIQWVPEHLQSVEIYIAAVSQDGGALEFVNLATDFAAADPQVLKDWNTVLSNVQVTDDQSISHQESRMVERVIFHINDMHALEEPVQDQIKELIKHLDRLEFNTDELKQSFVEKVQGSAKQSKHQRSNTPTL